MSYNVGDIVLVKFPFTNLKKAKKRPVLVIKSSTQLNDIICLQITSKDDQKSLMHIKQNDLRESIFSVESYVKYDKCFTLNEEVIDKKIGCVTELFLKNLVERFCKEIF